MTEGDIRPDPRVYYFIVDQEPRGYKVFLPKDGELPPEIKNAGTEEVQISISPEEYFLAYQAEDNALAHDLFAPAFMREMNDQSPKILEFICLVSRNLWESLNPNNDGT